MGISFGGGLHTKAAKDEMRKQGGRGLLIAAEYLLAESNKLVPHEEGTLERSGHTSLDQSKLKAAISYNTPYAVEQHEMMHYRHSDGRQAKFLESTMNSKRAEATKIIADAIKGAL